jgi:GNAT superfamily N-acetyltransferase
VNVTSGYLGAALPDWFVARAVRFPPERITALALLADHAPPGMDNPSVRPGDVYVLVDPADDLAARPLAVAVVWAGDRPSVDTPRVLVAPTDAGPGLAGRLLVAVADTLRASGVRRLRAALGPSDASSWAVLLDAGLVPTHDEVGSGEAKAHFDLEL